MKVRLSGFNILHILLLVSFLVASAFYIVIPWFRADQIFVSSEYCGVIKEIRHTEGDRGIPDILIDNQWRSLTMDEAKIVPHLQIGDSVVKRHGRAIDVYRDKNGVYEFFNRY